MTARRLFHGFAVASLFAFLFVCLQAPQIFPFSIARLSFNFSWRNVEQLRWNAHLAGTRHAFNSTHARIDLAYVLWTDITLEPLRSRCHASRVFCFLPLGTIYVSSEKQCVVLIATVAVARTSRYKIILGLWWLRNNKHLQLLLQWRFFFLK